MTSAGDAAGSVGSQELQVRFERFQARFPIRSVQVGPAAWNYLDTGGQGPVLLMLPGGTYRPDNYFQLIEDLARDHRILAPAYPAIHPLPLVVAGLTALLDYAGVGSATVCGWSYGGYVAQVFAKEAPSRVRNLVLAETGTRHTFGLTTMRASSPRCSHACPCAPSSRSPGGCGGAGPAPCLKAGNSGTAGWRRNFSR